MFEEPVYDVDFHLFYKLLVRTFVLIQKIIQFLDRFLEFIMLFLMLCKLWVGYFFLQFFFGLEMEVGVLVQIIQHFNGFDFAIAGFAGCYELLNAVDQFFVLGINGIVSGD